MAQHSTELVETLLALGRSPAGRLVSVFGDPLARGAYWAGRRFSPVQTLFEAVTRCVLAGEYKRIIAFTGQDHRLLPRWRVGANFRLCDEAAIWVVRGEEVGRRPAARRAESRTPWEEGLDDDLDMFTSGAIDRLLWRSANRTYWDRLDNYIRRVDEEVRRAAGGERSALVVDFSFLMPTVQEAPALREGGFDVRLVNEIRTRIGRDLSGTGVDLFLVSEEGLAHDLLRNQNGEPPILAKLLETYMTQHEWEVYRPKLEREMPHLFLGESHQRVEAARSVSPVASALVNWPTAGTPQPLYQQLRAARLNRNPSSAAPPKHADEIALEFWANVDLTPLEAALEDEIIGQEQAKQVVLGILRAQKEKCAQLLERNHQARKTVRDANFCLPVVGFFGAAGMGKSTLCEVLVNHLFDDARFGRRIDLGGKSLKVATIGIEPPMVGSEDTSDLISFCNETRGLGVVCFDEFTRLQLPQQTTLSNALGPLLEILQARKLEPANPRFRPPSRFYHFANTLFVFSGNVSPSGERAPEGFESIDSLGTAFSSRVTKPVYFTPLAEADYRRAARRALSRAALDWARDFDPDAHQRTGGSVEVDDRLAAAVERRFRDDLRAGGHAPSLRTLNALLVELNYARAFDAGRERDGDRLVLGVEILPAEWGGGV